MAQETDDFDFKVFLPKVKSIPEEQSGPGTLVQNQLPTEKDWLRKIDPLNMFLYGMIAGIIATVIGAFIFIFLIERL
jgi:hypothetical protein